LGFGVVAEEADYSEGSRSMVGLRVVAVVEVGEEA
jgi:hypothetical protein